jgi:small subunit ribosomal protein S27Ae
MRNNELYEIKDNKIQRKRKFCPKCEGAFLAQHDDRLSCGRCGHTETIKRE